MRQSRSATDNLRSASSHSLLSLCEQTLVNCTNNSNKRRDDPENWLIPTTSSVQTHSSGRPRVLPVKPSNPRASGQRQALRAASELGGKSHRGYYAQTVTSSKKSVPTRVLKYPGRSQEKRRESMDQSSSKRSFTQTRSDRSPASEERQKSSAIPAKPGYERQSTFSGNRVTRDLGTVARRNRWLEQSAPLKFKFSKIGDAEQVTSRRPVLRQCQTSRYSSATNATRPAAQHRMQRKVHDSKIPDVEPASRKTRTYSVKKPLPYKPQTCAKARGYKSAATLPSVAECPHTVPSMESVVTQISESWSCDNIQDDEDYEDIDTDDATAIIMRAAEMISKPRVRAASRRTPTPKPSLNQLKGVRTELDQRQQTSRTSVSGVGRELREHASSWSLKSRSSNRISKDQLKKASTVLSHSSPSQHSFTNKRDEGHQKSEQEHRQQMYNEQTTSGCVECAPRHSRNTPDNIPAREQKQPPGETETSAMSSASQESVHSCESYHKSAHCPSKIPHPTASMCTLVDETASRLDKYVFAGKRCKSKPVIAALSGPAGHCRNSKLPRPKPTSSAQLTPSECSSVISLRSDFNYVRPMPVERIPFSKFGIECIVPLFKREASATVVDAYSIAGVTGQRKPLLPLTDNISIDIWEMSSVSANGVAPLPLSTAGYDNGERRCEVKIISTNVARSVSNAATQTRKSVSLTPCKCDKCDNSRKWKRAGKPMVKQRKDKTIKIPDEVGADYSSLLVRLVQLLYLQTKMDSQKADQNNSAGTKSKNQPPSWKYDQTANTTTPSSPVPSATVIYPQAQDHTRDASPAVRVKSNSLLGYLQQQQQPYDYSYPAASAERPPMPTPTATITPHTRRWDNTRVYPMSSAAQDYSKNQSNRPVYRTPNVQSVNTNWTNDVMRRSTLTFPANSQPPQSTPKPSAWPYRATPSPPAYYDYYKQPYSYASPRNDYYY